MTAIRAVVTDIEGTTTPLAFVHEVLFPYARKRLRQFVKEHEDNPFVFMFLHYFPKPFSRIR